MVDFIMPLLSQFISNRTLLNLPQNHTRETSYQFGTCQELQSSCRRKVFYTVRFLFDRLLLFGREISGTLLLALEAYASSRTSSPC
ncbi:hypothetical protein POTOM_001842 [Populus tomentosa]|uniref:Uncharacterized protein n=1 Tax=Populus tomentosa TaxID=118781 RepID=A0A8X8DIN4_POPTO|nr:hypothetical protein POTOM_001842 [Populus tomentosa]